MSGRSPAELLAAGVEPPDDPRRTCVRCGKTPVWGSWCCVVHDGDVDLSPVEMAPGVLARWRAYWEPS